MQAQPPIHTNRLLLRPLEITDAPVIRLLAGDERVALMTENIPHPYEESMAEAWIEGHPDAWAEQTHATFGICKRQSGDLFGCVGLTLAARHRRASLGYWIGVDFWGNGYCTEAAQAVINFGFDTLKLVRIQATHLARNPASGAVMRKIGMQHEATLQKYVINCGSSQAVEQYAILSKDG